MQRQLKSSYEHLGKKDTQQMHFWHLQITKSYSALCPLGISHLTEITKYVLDETAVIAAAMLLLKCSAHLIFSI